MNRAFLCSLKGPCPTRYRGKHVIINDNGVATAGSMGRLDGRKYLCPTLYESLEQKDHDAILLEAKPLPLFGEATGTIGDIILLLPEQAG